MLERDNGEKYEGYFYNNQFHGKGKFSYAPDDTYGQKYCMGFFEHDQLHGPGTMVWTNGDSCKCTWVYNQMEGTGTYKWANGIKSKILLSNGEMTFEPPLIYPDEDFRKEYLGGLKNGYVMHGEGTLTLKNGKQYTGQWIAGSIAAYAEEISSLETDWL